MMAIFLLILAIYLFFFDYPAHLKTWMESESSRILGRRVTIDRLSVNIPNSFELRGVVAEPLGPGPPWLEFESLRGELDLSRIIQREIQLGLLHVTGLVLRVNDYGGGQVDLPGLYGLSGPTRSHSLSAASFNLLVDRIVFENASVVYNNQTLPWSLEARELSARFEREGGKFSGALEYRQGEFQIKDRPPAEGSLEARLEVDGREIRVSELIARGSFYQVRAEGTIELGKEPRAEMSLEVESRVAFAARSLLGLSQLDDSGTTPASFEGTLTFGRGWHELEGRVDVPAARFAGLPVRNWTGEVYWDRSRVEVVSAEGLLAGGLSRWNLRQPLPLGGDPAEIEVQFGDVPLQTLLEAIRGEPGPLASRISGQARFDVLLSDPDRMNGDFELAGKAAESSGEASGLDFTASGVFEDGSLTLDRSRFETEFADVVLSGEYPLSGPANLRLALDARDLSRVDEVQQLLRTLLHPERPARRLQITGRGRASGSLTGRLPRMRFEGDFAGSAVHFRDTRLDHVDARGSLNADTVHFESFRAGKDDASFLGRGELAFGPTPPSDWAFIGEASNWPAADFQSLLSLPLWLEGKLSGDVSFISQDHQLGGEGTLRVVAGSLRGRRFDRAEGRLELVGREIILDPISVTRRDGRVNGRLRFDLDADSFEGRLTAERYSIAELVPETLNGEGHLDAEIRLGGSLQQPWVDVEARSPLLELSGLPVGRASLEAQLREGTVDGKLRIQGEHFELEAQSQIQLSPDYPITGHTTWRGAELGGWFRSAVVGVPDSLSFVSDGAADFQGNLSSLVDTLSADVAMKKILLDAGDYQLALSTPVKVQILNGAVMLEALPLSGADTQLELSGRLPLGSSNLDVQARGSVNLEIIHSIFPSVSSAGGVDLSARVTGSWERPFLSGHAEIKGGTLLFQGFPQALGDLHGRVSFDNRTVRFADIQARFGGAPVTLSGTMLLRGLSIDSLELEARGRGLRLRYPEGLVATLDADLSLSGTSSSQILSGRVEVEEATWSREYDLSSGILDSREADAFEILEEMGEEGPLSNLSFDVDIVAPGTLRVRNSRATIDARAELELRGTFAHPALLGRSESLRGEVFLLGQRYRLLSGRVDFVDPTTVKPFFDLVAEARVRSYRIELRLSGTPERFFPELSSDPPLRTVDILRLLAGASERDILIGSEEEELAGVGVATLLTERLTQEVSRRAERLFGLDRFSIDPFLVGQFTNPTARVSLGKQIYRDLSVSYSTNLNEATETLILIEYTPEGPINWIISRDEEGSLGVDLRFRKSF